MLRHKFAIAAILPLLWSSFALAGDADDPAPDQASEHHHSGRGEDAVAWRQKACADRYARRVGRLAYIEAKLDLTEQQRAAWGKFKQARIDTASQVRAACLEIATKTVGQPNAIEREARFEKLLSIRLQGLQASRPALQALYDVLTPEQKTVLDHSRDGRRHGWRHGWRHERS